MASRKRRAIIEEESAFYKYDDVSKELRNIYIM